MNTPEPYKSLVNGPQKCGWPEPNPPWDFATGTAWATEPNTATPTAPAQTPRLEFGSFDNWFVIEPYSGTGQPEGDMIEWVQIITAMKARKRESFKRIGVHFDDVGDACFWSPRNSMDSNAAHVPACR